MSISVILKSRCTVPSSVYSWKIQFYFFLKTVFSGLIVIFPWNSALGMQNVKIEVEWEYVAQDNNEISGFRLYNNNQIVCETFNSLDRIMQCSIDANERDTSFTMTAIFTNGSESLHSEAYFMSLPELPQDPVDVNPPKPSEPDNNITPPKLPQHPIEDKPTIPSEPDDNTSVKVPAYFHWHYPSNTSVTYGEFPNGHFHVDGLSLMTTIGGLNGIALGNEVTRSARVESTLQFAFEPDVTKINIQVADFDGNTTITCYDLNGNILDQFSVQNKDIQNIDLSHLSNVRTLIVRSAAGFVGSLEYHIDYGSSGLTNSQWYTAFYVAYWGRAGDPAGLGYWRDEVRQGKLTVPCVAENFALSTEAKALYPYLNEPASATYYDRVFFLQSVYSNLLNREISTDDPGLTYWVDELSHGRTTPGAVIGNMIYAAIQLNSNDWLTIWHKIQVAEYLTQMIHAQNRPWQESDRILARQVLEMVTDDPASTEAGFERVNKAFNILPRNLSDCGAVCKSSTASGCPATPTTDPPSPFQAQLWPDHPSRPATPAGPDQGRYPSIPALWLETFQ